MCIMNKLQAMQKHRQDQAAMHDQAKAITEYRNIQLNYLDLDVPYLVLRLQSRHT